ncbi:Gfo/Idh/MocA family oxidoreductase [bacterium]|nr:Gfo/Idh/MocA family oxidoreductase [bacterium]
MEKVRIGVIGVGGMGGGHCHRAKLLQDENKQVELACVCDINEEVAKERAEKFQTKYFLNYKELIDSGLCDAVVVATPHWVHPEISVYAFEKGLHVLCEKPIAVTVSGADEIIEAAKKSGKVFSVNYQRRLQGLTLKLKEIVESGELGEIHRTLCVDPWQRTQSYYDSGTWRATWVGEGGGVLCNQAPHTIDMFTHIGGMPIKIQAQARAKFHRIEVEDEVQASLEYENGAWGCYYTSTCESEGPLHMEFVGDKGKLVVRGTDVMLSKNSQPLREYILSADKMWDKMVVTHESVELVPDIDKTIMENFRDAILKGEKRLTPGEKGINAVEFFNACIMSAKLDKPVNIPVPRKEYDELMEELKKTSKEKTGVKEQRVTDPKLQNLP